MALTNNDRTWIEGHFDKMRELIVANQIEIAKLKVKSGIWGAIGASAVLLGAYLLRK